MKKVLVGLAITFVMIAFVAILDKPKPEGTVLIGGGPEGSTLLVFAEQFARLLHKEVPELNASVITSGGSVANLKNIQAGKLDLALAYGGDIYLGYQGRLIADQPPFDNVLVLGRVYGSTAQLGVAKDSIVMTPYDLINRRVAVGCSGSGSAHSAERYFRAIGIWDKIIPLYLGYDLGIQELYKGRAEAIWQLAGTPSPSIVKLVESRPIRLISLLDAAKEHDFFTNFPFYTEAIIPSGTYEGLDQPVTSYQDNTILVTHKNVDQLLVDTSLEILFSPQGVAYMRHLQETALDFQVSLGLQGVQTPLYPSAVQFWWKQGLKK